MKQFVGAIAAAVLLATLILSPAAAAAPEAVAASDSCGDTYTVQRLDYLAKIARQCDTTVSSILSLNPQITNPNLIYTGQVLRLTEDAPEVSWPSYNYGSGYYYPYYSYSYGSGTTSSGSARVTVSSTRAQAGDTITVSISGFPKDASIDYRVGERGEDYSEVYDGTVDDDGTDSKAISIPDDADVGEYWVVQVVTTDQVKVTSVTSSSIYIGTTSSSTTYSGEVTLSKTRAAAGDTVKVYVSGFPPNAEIDYRIGKKGESYSAVYDGTVGSNGSTSKTITIPGDADEGEYWVVKVITTSLRTVTSVTSPSIYITD
jgi:LysM repeat protein